MKTIDLFVHRAGDPKPKLVKVAEDVEFGAFAQALGAGEHPNLFVGEGGEPLVADRPLSSQGVKNGAQVLVHTCKKVAVKVVYNGRTVEKDFPPSVPLRAVQAWATAELSIPPADARDLVLRVCGTAEPLDEHLPLGTFTKDTCEVCFDLAPKIRVEG